MVTVPVSTVEKPLTAIDYMVPLAECRTARDVGEYADAVPLEVRLDDRFGRAVAARLNELMKARRRA